VGGDVFLNGFDRIENRNLILDFIYRDSQKMTDHQRVPDSEEDEMELQLYLLGVLLRLMNRRGTHILRSVDSLFGSLLVELTASALESQVEAISVSPIAVRVVIAAAVRYVHGFH
jgi:hypothetical protein